MSLQERTLVIKNFDPDQTTNQLLRELCMQAGPIRNVVLKPDHAFVEFEDVESVGYSKALLDGIRLFGRPLIMEPKLRHESYLKYTKLLNDYIIYDKKEREMKRIQEQQRKSIEQMRRMAEQPMQMLTLPPPPQLLQVPYDQMPPLMQPLEQNFLPTPPPSQLQQQSPIYYQVPPQYQPPPQPYQTYQAPPDILRQQFIQTSPYIANPLRPAPEGRGYMPWMHEPIDRSVNFHNLHQNHAHQQQQRHLFDRLPDFTNRRR